MLFYALAINCLLPCNYIVQNNSNSTKRNNKKYVSKPSVAAKLNQPEMSKNTRTKKESKKVSKQEEKQSGVDDDILAWLSRLKIPLPKSILKS